jgi:hypothetical protein
MQRALRRAARGRYQHFDDLVAETVDGLICVSTIGEPELTPDDVSQEERDYIKAALQQMRTRSRNLARAVIIDS